MFEGELWLSRLHSSPIRDIGAPQLAAEVLNYGAVTDFKQSRVPGVLTKIPTVQPTPFARKAGSRAVTPHVNSYDIPVLFNVQASVNWVMNIHQVEYKQPEDYKTLNEANIGIEEFKPNSARGTSQRPRGTGASITQPPPRQCRVTARQCRGKSRHDLRQLAAAVCGIYAVAAVCGTCLRQFWHFAAAIVLHAAAVALATCDTFEIVCNSPFGTVTNLPSHCGTSGSCQRHSWGTAAITCSTFNGLKCVFIHLPESTPSPTIHH
ncbi:hypothetical protein B0H16DRAFT_1450852 [Mycena metata]|uniref:Uncharacterized protein n=1 Tax=Mycena metata TaxID=1033252 RepID=A0AAD7NSR0_9AGAR|nr:hypothetical protein B0H16DRAFT_1450852 [Mycena metata]